MADKLCHPCVFPPQTGEWYILPVRAIDGDTVEFYFLVGGVARLHGIDAPERGTPGGPPATQFLASILPHEPVRAVLHGRDKYGRTLMTLYNVDGREINQALVDTGYAVPYQPARLPGGA